MRPISITRAEAADATASVNLLARAHSRRCSNAIPNTDSHRPSRPSEGEPTPQYAWELPAARGRHSNVDRSPGLTLSYDIPYKESGSAARILDAYGPLHVGQRLTGGVLNYKEGVSFSVRPPEQATALMGGTLDQVYKWGQANDYLPDGGAKRRMGAVEDGGTLPDRPGREPPHPSALRHLPTAAGEYKVTACRRRRTSR